MNKTLPFTFFKIHPKAILLEWQQEPNSDLLHELNCFKEKIKNHFKEFSQITQGYCSLLIQLKSNIENSNKINNKLILLHKNINTNKSDKISKHWSIPVLYEGLFGLDLEYLSIELKLSIEKIISLHTKKTYNVYFIGFLPGFLYLEGLDSRLFFTRKKTPRLKIPKGAVAIGGKQTGIYPDQSPGGWQIIGNTPIKLFKPNDKKPCFASSGDTLSFYPVSFEQYTVILNSKNQSPYLKSKK